MSRGMELRVVTSKETEFETGLQDEQDWAEDGHLPCSKRTSSSFLRTSEDGGVWK